MTNDNLDNIVVEISKVPIIKKLLEIICDTTNMGFAAVAKVTRERWIVCSVKDNINFGLHPGGELKVETTICHEVRQSNQSVIIDHVDKDNHFSTHPTPKMYGFQSYISVPIFRQDKTFFGTLCAIDPNPAFLNNPKVITLFETFAEVVSLQLESIEVLYNSEANLMAERSESRLREQFIAILGHDLRNPLGAIMSGADVLTLMTLDDNALRIATLIKKSSGRMNGIIKDVIDFAGSRLGSGIKLNLQNNVSVSEILNQVVSEFNALFPEQVINIIDNVSGPVNCDAPRLAQLFSNLISNAINYGKAGEPIVVTISRTPNEFILSISNAGDKIPDIVLNNLFQPFFRGNENSKKQGLGLGLYIATQIAEAHNGTLSVKSTDAQTTFTLAIPQ